MWSLGVILVNLTCGRNPWKRASAEDSTFRAYLKDSKFLKSILPLSSELDAILRRIFEYDPQKRITIPELRGMILRCPRFTNRPAILPPSPRCSVDYDKESIFGGIIHPYQQTSSPPIYASPPSPPADAITAQFSHLTTASNSSSASDNGSVFSVTSTSSSSSSHSDYGVTHKADLFTYVAPPPQTNFYGGLIPATDLAEKLAVPQPFMPAVQVC